MDLEQTWRWFHQHAEVSFKEYETTKRIKDLLAALEGVELLDLGLATGALARIIGAHKGPVIMLRSDIDALPIKEQTRLETPSLHEGTMHACGHDWHIVNLLRTAQLLAQARKDIHGTILLLFQPAEESGGGAKKVVETGLFQKYPISRVFGLHIQPQLEAGTIALCNGAISAAVDRFTITIGGKGCHGAHPESGLDPIPAACQLAISLEGIVARRLQASDKAVVSVTHLEGGSSWNIIPDQVVLEGTNRTFDPQVRALIKRCFEEKCHALECEGYRVNLDLKWGTPATSNDPGLTDLVRDEARKEGLQVVELDGNEMAGEDFSYYQQLVPGSFYHVGVGGAYPLHSPHLEIDRKCLDKSAHLLCQVALRAGREA